LRTWAAPENCNRVLALAWQWIFENRTPLVLKQL
jgi:hypothetical protein